MPKIDDLLEPTWLAMRHKRQDAEDKTAGRNRWLYRLWRWWESRSEHSGMSE